MKKLFALLLCFVFVGMSLQNSYAIESSENTKETSKESTTSMGGVSTNSIKDDVLPYHPNKKLISTSVVQSNGYYCGPASVVNVLKCFSITKDQDSMAKSLGTTKDNGTDMSKMPGVLNNNQSKYKYSYHNYTSKADFRNTIAYNIYNNRPSIIEIAATDTSQWDFKTGGHYITIVGYVSSSAKPWDYASEKAWVAETYGAKKGTVFLVGTNKLYTAANNHWRKYIVS